MIDEVSDSYTEAQQEPEIDCHDVKAKHMPDKPTVLYNLGKTASGCLAQWHSMPYLRRLDAGFVIISAMTYFAYTAWILTRPISEPDIY